MLILPVSSLKKTKSENVPPVSTVTRYCAIGVSSIIKRMALQSYFARDSLVLGTKVGEINQRALAVIPAKAGIQKFLIFWIPGRASYRQLARNDAQIPQPISEHHARASIRKHVPFCS